MLNWMRFADSGHFKNAASIKENVINSFRVVYQIFDGMTFNNVTQMKNYIYPKTKK